MSSSNVPSRPMERSPSVRITSKVMDEEVWAIPPTGHATRQYKNSFSCRNQLPETFRKSSEHLPSRVILDFEQRREFETDLQIRPNSIYEHLAVFLCLSPFLCLFPTLHVVTGYQSSQRVKAQTLFISTLVSVISLRKWEFLKNWQLFWIGNDMRGIVKGDANNNVLKKKTNDE